MSFISIIVAALLYPRIILTTSNNECYREIFSNNDSKC